jgi:uncharacterized coiled-coil protein SlyX|nr:MAG TPA: putative DNA-binding protein [Caudoviricetes sp.]
MQEKRQESSTIKRNILRYLESKGISQYQCYKDTGITRGVLGQSTGISEDNLIKFLDHYKDVSIEWLITGDGDMLLDESATRTTQHVNGNNNTFAGRDLNTSVANLPELIAMTDQHQSTISDLVSTISKQQTTISNQQTTISELVNTVSRQQQDISLLLGHKSDQD